MSSDARGESQLDGRVAEHLHTGEALRAVVLVSRADGRTAVGVSRGEMSPFRLRIRRAEVDGPGARRGVQGRPDSLAVGLDEHIRIVTHPRVLALTERRLMVLRKRAGLFGLGSKGVPPLRLLWECRREELVSAGERGGHLRLSFRDGSAVTLLTPSAGVRDFLAG